MGSNTRYYEAKGAIRKTVLAFRDKLEKGRREMFKFAARFGCKEIKVASSFSTAFWLVPPSTKESNGITHWDTSKLDPKLWKQIRRHGEYTHEYAPRLGCKEGKALVAEMAAICGRHGAADDLIKIIGGDYALVADTGGFHWYVPGFRIVGRERVIITYRAPNFTPADPKQLVRLSDVEFEKLAATRPKKRKKTKA